MRMKTYFLIVLFLTQLLVFGSLCVVANGATTIVVPDDYSNIQAAIDSAAPGDTIFVRNGTYHESLTIEKIIVLVGEDKAITIINGLGELVVVDISSDDVFMSGFTVLNGSTGVDVSYADGVVLSDIIVHNNTYDGISVSESSDNSIVNCSAYNNDFGIAISGCINTEIIGCDAYNNSDYGVYSARSRNLQIIDTSCYYNEYGVNLYQSDVASICSSSFHDNNYYGLYAVGCDLMYLSRSSITNNLRDGTHIWSSSGVIACSNFTGNMDDGLNFFSSDFTLRGCSLHGNGDYEIESSSSSIDARYCWWGSSSGPSVSNGGLQYDPWQTTLDQPDVLISDFRCQLNQLDWQVIYPDQEIPKPLDCVAASVSDWLASAFVTTKLGDFTEGLDTQDAFVDQITGEIQADPGKAILTFGGPIVNPIVKRAENSSTPEGDQAPVKWHGEGGVYYFQYKNGTNIPGAELPLSVINDDEDLFVIERYVDNNGRIITISYGFGWKGTYAAGKIFDTQLYPQQAKYTVSWIIIKWEDTNQDGFVNNPGEGDTYTIIATG
jgi:parallel beta-helix repeat protein